LFLELPLRRLCRRQERVLDDLLRNGRRALEVLLVAAHVRDEGADHANRIDSRMRIEPLVLDREDGVFHVLRNQREWHEAALLSRRERREQWRLQRDLIDGLAGGVRHSSHDGRYPGGERDFDGL